MDGKVHKVAPPQSAEYKHLFRLGTFTARNCSCSRSSSGDSGRHCAIATQPGQPERRRVGPLDTHNAGVTHVMNGDPAAPAIADILAFGSRNFDAKAAYKSLLQAATVPTAHDLSHEGCPVECVGQRPSLDQWLKLHYIPVGAHAWGPRRTRWRMRPLTSPRRSLRGGWVMSRNRSHFMERAQYWKNIFNPQATPQGGYIQNRNADGTWPKFDPKSTEGFVEGSGAQYVWMVPFNAKGLFKMMGGDAKANERLNAFFYNPDGSPCRHQLGSVARRAQQRAFHRDTVAVQLPRTALEDPGGVRKVLNTIWANTPKGLPGNDDLGEISSWYVWAAIGMYPRSPAEPNWFSAARCSKASPSIAAPGTLL